MTIHIYIYNKVERMKKYYLLLLVLAIAGCTSNTSDDSDKKEPRTQVTLTHAEEGSIDSYVELTATTAYLRKAVITAPVPAYISSISIAQGSVVRAGQTLFSLQSKEQMALGDNREAIAVRAKRSGIVIDVNQQAGDYVAEGVTLCTIVERGSMAFELNLPYEQRRYAKTGGTCTIELPDGSRLKAAINRPLLTMNEPSQTWKIVATAANTPLLPEGLTVKALLPTGHGAKGTLLLPTQAVQSDEKMTHHWVVRMANDSFAIHVPVTVGNSRDGKVEIVHPTISTTDRIVLTGGYALPDSALVTITSK